MIHRWRISRCKGCGTLFPPVDGYCPTCGRPLPYVGVWTILVIVLGIGAAAKVGELLGLW